ncbi:MAG: glutamate--tRNA ligase [Mucilaginibacter polytrichastri]|nr:glutamate--tRNA ligase [Mucilaginibacter polytrichastri]
MQPLHSRIAPTPSGFLHRGNAFNFVLTWLLVRRSGGTLRLRIDDYDLPRVRKEYVDDVFRLLDWLQIDWDEGPKSPDDHFRNFSSAHRMELYRDLLEKLRRSGKTYYCTCSRKTQVKQACHCREQHHSAGAIKLQAARTIRFHDIFQGEKGIHVEDFTVWRRDGLPAYQLASVADDAFFGTDFIVRGNDLPESTAAQILLAETAGMSVFSNIRFGHHPLMLDDRGGKLSKSAGSAAMKNLYQSYRQRSFFFRKFSIWLGYSVEFTSAEELLRNAVIDMNQHFNNF